MITYAIKTWRYIAFPALLFMIIAVFLFANALQTASLTGKDVEKNGRVTCMLGDQLDEEIVTQLSKAGNGSFVYETEARLLCQSMEKTIKVTGIDGKMLTGDLVCGTCYTDGDSSLSLVVNQALIFELIDKETTTIDDLMKWMNQSLVMGGCAAKICGVIDDGSELPMIYISVAAVESYLRQQGDVSQTKSYCIIASDLKNMEAIQKEMNKNGIMTSIDQQRMFDWELELVQIKNQVIMGIIAFLGFLSSIRLTVKMRISQEVSPRKGVMFVRIIVNVCVGIVGGLVLHGFIRLWII